MRAIRARCLAWCLACLAMCQCVEDTCEDSALLHARNHRTSLAGKAQVLQAIAEANGKSCPFFEAELNSGNCTGGTETCANCPSPTDVPPNATLDRFPNNRLFCGGGNGNCDDSVFNFKNPNDYLECQGAERQKVCENLTASNVGAGCCTERACPRSNISLSSDGGCQSDMCCVAAEVVSTCDFSALSGVRSLLCQTGLQACRSISALVSRDVICIGESACSGAAAFQVQAGGDHIVDCIGPGACENAGFDFASDSNISVTCNELFACDDMTIQLTGNSCIDVNCSDDSGCGDLTVAKTQTDTCYYQGPDVKTPRGCNVTAMPMCGEIQRAPICCQGSGGCANCCPDPTTSTSSTSSTTSTTESSTSSTTSTTTTSSTTTTKKPYSHYGRHRRFRRIRRAGQHGSR